MVAVAIGTGVGTNALLAKSLGQGKQEKANQVCGNAIFLGVIICIVFILFAFWGVPAYVRSQSAGGAISETVLAMAIDYLQICCGISVGIVFFSIFEKMLQATGRSLYSTIGQITGAVINLIFDPILIYGWLGFPEMGVKGAAYATVAGQIVSAVLVFIFHLKMNREIKTSWRYLKPSWGIIREIYAIGLPAIISQALLTVMTYGLNRIFGQIRQVGENVVTVYGLYCKIQQLVIFAAVGLRDAITPIVSFNYGMGSGKRVRSGIRYGLLYTAVLMIIGMAVIEIFAKPLTGFFALSDVTFDICVDCMRIVSLALLFAGLSIALQGVFQALECGIESLVISLGRQVVFILPVAWVLTKFVDGLENVSLVWWTFMIGEVITLLIGVLMYRRVSKKKIRGIIERG
jgi:putative MATE family efflux protein